MPKDPATRLAQLKTWCPEKQTQRVRKTRRLPYTGDVEALIKAADLLPAVKSTIIQVRLMAGQAGLYLELAYGTNRAGVATTVDVTLEPADLRTFVGYLLTKADPALMMGVFHLPDSGEGKEVVAPRVSVAALAAMSVSARVQ